MEHIFVKQEKIGKFGAEMKAQIIFQIGQHQTRSRNNETTKTMYSNTRSALAIEHFLASIVMEHLILKCHIFIYLIFQECQEARK